MYNIKTTLTTYICILKPIKEEHLLVDNMIYNLSKELLLLCLDFAQDIGWTKVLGQVGRVPILGQQSKKREKHRECKTFCTSLEEDNDAERG